jgi:hypothetical protein
MNIDREILEKLVIFWGADKITTKSSISTPDVQDIYELFAMIEEELEKPEPKPDAWMDNKGNVSIIRILGYFIPIYK